jgi:hypothetical protein
VSRATIVEGKLIDRLATVGAENVVALTTALAVGAIALTASGRPAYLPGVLLLAAPPVAGHFLRSRTTLQPDRVTNATANDLAAFTLYAASAVATQAAVSGLHHPLQIAGAAAVAWGAGLVVIVAPGGIGIREIVYVGLMGSTFPSGDLALGAVATRLVMIVAELGVLLAVTASPRTRPARPSPGA